MTQATITSKGQITIPAEFRKKPGYQPGDQVSIHLDVDGRLIIESFDDWLQRVRIQIPPERMLGRALTDEEMDEIVGKAIVEEYLNEDVADEKILVRSTHGNE